LAGLAQKLGFARSAVTATSTTMLTALVHAKSTPEALAFSLSALVPAVAEGLISHAVVILGPDRPSTERIADAMGATVLTPLREPWREAACIARGDWVLLLDAGEILDHGWIGAVERHLLHQTSARQRPAIVPAAGLLGRLRERAAMILGQGLLRSGLIAPRERVSNGQSGGVPVILNGTRSRLGG
jgi:hypothetical protein